MESVFSLPQVAINQGRFANYAARGIASELYERGWGGGREFLLFLPQISDFWYLGEAGGGSIFFLP